MFTDNLVNLMMLSGVCQFVFQMPAEIVFGRIVPGAAIAILAGVAVYTSMAKWVANKQGRDVTALPYGISTPVMFVYLFGVIGPIYWATSDPLLAWQVGIGAGFMGGIVAAFGAIVGPFLKRITPRAGMLGTLCGIALVFIGSVPLDRNLRASDHRLHVAAVHPLGSDRALPPAGQHSRRSGGHRRRHGDRDLLGQSSLQHRGHRLLPARCPISAT